MALVIYNNTYQKGKYPTSADELFNLGIRLKDIDKYILIVPTGRLTRFLKYNIYEEYFGANKKPCPKVTIITFDKFAEMLFQSVFKGFKYRFISEEYRISLMEEAIKKAELEFYKSQKNNQISYQLTNKIYSILFGLREDGINSEGMIIDLEKDKDGEIELRDSKKFSDLTKILKEYEKLLEGKYLDPPEILRKLVAFYDENNLNGDDVHTNCFDKHLNEIVPSVKQIMVYGFSEFKEPETQLLSKFAASSIPMSIHLDFSESNGPLFGNLKDTKLTLNTAGFSSYYTEDEESSIDYLNKDTNNYPVSSFLKRWLFNTEKEQRYEFNNSDNLINIFEFVDFDEEVTQITKLVKHLIVNRNYKPYEIAIATKNNEKFSKYLREKFYLERIPANFSERYLLSESPVIIAIFNVLETLANQYRSNEVLNCFRNYFLDFNTENHKIDFPNFLKVANELRLLSSSKRIGKENWIKRFTNGIKYLESIISKNIDSDDDYYLKIRYDNYNKAYRDLELFFSKMPEGQAHISPDDFKNLIVNDIIKNFRIPDKIREIYSETAESCKNKTVIERDIEIESVEKYSRALSQFMAVISEMIFIMKERGIKTQRLSLYIEKLKLLVAASKYQTRERLNYGVSITAIEQIREIPFKVTILCGLNDGQFPEPYHPDSFLGKEMPDSESRHLHSEQIQFYRFLTNGLHTYNSDKKIFLSYSKFRDTVESTYSPFIESLLKVSNLKIISLHNENLNSDNKEFTWYKSLSTKPDLAEYFGKQFFEKSSISEYKNLIPEYFRISAERSLSSDYFGVRSNQTEQKLKDEKEKVFSASDFELFNTCGYKYFANKILNIKELQKTDITIQPLEYGNLMHTALYKFYSELQKSDFDYIIHSEKSNEDFPDFKPVNIFKMDLSALKIKLKEIILNEFDDIMLSSPIIQLSKREILGDKYLRGTIEMFLENSLKLHNHYPVFFELGFGIKKNSRQIPFIKLDNGVKLKGKVDRVDLIFEDNNPNQIFFQVVDYKTSSKSSFSDSRIEKGDNFQAPLYSIAIKKILKEHYNVDATLHGVGFFILKQKDDEPKKDSLTFFKEVLLKDANKENPDAITYNKQNALIEQSLMNVSDIINKIADAKFELTENSTSCNYCDYAQVCKKATRQKKDYSYDEDYDFESEND